MLTDIETSHSTLNREFKTALAGIQRLSRQIKDAERVDGDEVRRIGADIHREAVRLDSMIEGMLEIDDEDDTHDEGVAEFPAGSGVAVGVGPNY